MFRWQKKKSEVYGPEHTDYNNDTRADGEGKQLYTYDQGTEAYTKGGYDMSYYESSYYSSETYDETRARTHTSNTHPPQTHAQTPLKHTHK